MKKQLSIIALSLMCLATWAATEIDGINYNLNSNGTAEVRSKSPKYEGNVIIPESVTYGDKTYSVTSIGNYAFSDCRGLTSVTIGNSVKSIGEGAFYFCEGLKNVTITNNVTSMGHYAFYGCIGLTNIIIPNSVTSIGRGVFYGCMGLTSVTISNNLTSIGDGTFSFCERLTSITIPNSVTSIDWGVFEGCIGLTSVVIPSSVTSIGGSAFRDCTKLKSVVLGSGVKTIDDSAFYGCTNFQSITCYRMLPPTVSGSSQFYTLPYSTIVYVPAEAFDAYNSDAIWGLYDVRPLGAASVQVDDLLITPHYTTIDVTWPSVANAANYEITITSNGIVICKLTFDAQGQLTSISFRAPAAESARAAGQGFQFTVTGLDGCSAYSLTINAKDASGNVLKTFSQDFTTEGYTAIEEVNADGTSLNPRKVLEDGRVIILMPDGRKFDTNGRALGK